MQEKRIFNLICTVEHIVYQNDENGYTVMEVSTNDELITAVGQLAGIAVGEEVKLMGSYITHAQYGTQFKVEACERKFPKTSEAILKYLSSNAIKGIGPSTATRIVEKFGDRSLEIIERDPDKLAEVKGISKSKACQIGEEFKKIYGIRYLMAYLSRFSVSQLEIVRAWKAYGLKAIETIEQNPFVLCEDEIGMQFEKADEIRKHIGIADDSKIRIEAGILYILRHNLSNGHTCIPLEQLSNITARMMNCEYDAINEAYLSLCENKKIFIDYDDNDMAFLYSYYEAEIFIANRISMMNSLKYKNVKSVDSDIAKEEKELDIQFEIKQKKAIREAMTQGVMILTGGPGTGKTTTINAIIRLCEKQGDRVMLTAPTGRAAKRMSEVTGREAKTIHRLLEVDYTIGDLPKFKRNEENPLSCDLIIVDEISMVDTILFSSLLRSMKIGTRLLLVGDSDQLPSVGAGCVLRDMVESDCITVVELTEVFRQAAKSLIITNAHDIVKGEMPDLSIKDNDFFFLHSDDYLKSRALTVDLCNRRLPNSYGFSSTEDIQVIAPGRKGELGSYELNRSLQSVLNPPSETKKEIRIDGTVFRVGDKIMQIKNNYDVLWENSDGEHGTGIFNGDIGFIEMIDKTANTVTLRFDDKHAVYPIELMNEVEHAYAITVHKSQGCEFEAVVLVLMNGFEKLYYRNLLYTAVTRAKKLLIIIGKYETIANMVNNDRRVKRFTCLQRFIRKTINEE